MVATLLVSALCCQKQLVVAELREGLLPEQLVVGELLASAGDVSEVHGAMGVGWSGKGDQ
jgi:hypothetical protein